MDIFESLKMATNTLIANKLRSSLTMLGIVIGNASVIAMVGVGQGAQKLASDQFEALGPNLLFIVPGSERNRRTSFDLPKTLVLEDAEAIASQVPSVAAVNPQINSTQTIIYRNQTTSNLVIGTTPNFLTVRNFTLAEGRFINDTDLKRNKRVAVLGAELAKKFLRDRPPEGQQIRIKNVTFKVIGVLEAKGSFLGNNQDESVIIPLNTMANQIVGKTSPFGTQVSFLSISVRETNKIRAAKFQIENLLRLRHKITGEDDFGVQSQKDILQIVGSISGALTLLLAAIAAISLLVGGIGVMNIMLVSVSERTQEIGLRKAIGAKEKDILLQFLIESIILSAVGGIIGTLVGVGTIVLVGSLTPLSPGISPVAILMAVSVSGGIGLFFGVFPARQAAKLDPIVALRSM